MGVKIVSTPSDFGPPRVILLGAKKGVTFRLLGGLGALFSVTGGRRSVRVGETLTWGDGGGGGASSLLVTGPGSIGGSGWWEGGLWRACFFYFSISCFSTNFR